MKVLCLLFVAVLCSCSATQPQAQTSLVGLKPHVSTPSEYIITLVEDFQIEELKNQLGDYSMIVVKSLGRGRYLVRFDHDPGLDVLKKKNCFKNLKCKVQPNFKYQHF